ncbi:MAG: hypothetical protein HYR96_10775 [Deltaproteobacteria bacterium]|nr:hypothetical protein [Deltaproteobacteria bacterium]MBI3293628.1 hypothetical protein [Deltaproteobacteria bacterium]
MRMFGKAAAVGLILVLGLIGCTNKRFVGSNYGLNYCDGSLGSFDIYTVPNASGTYDVYVEPVKVNAPGDIVNIAISSANYDDPRTLSNTVVLQDGREIHAGVVSANELQDKEYIEIFSSEIGATYQPNRAQAEAVCVLPMPGDAPGATAH